MIEPGGFAEAFLARERELKEQQELAERVAKQVLDAMAARDTVSATDVASRRREEVDVWRDERKTRSESWDRIESEETGELSMSDEEAIELLSSLKRRRKRTARQKG